MCAVGCLVSDQNGRVEGVVHCHFLPFADSKPDPSTHVRIVSLGDKLLTLGSIRKPKRLTIHGHDEKEYQFLIKVCVLCGSLWGCIPQL